MRAAPIAVAALAGLVAGAVVFLVTDAVSNSRIAFGSLALFGNGALVVPVLLVPLVLYAGWTILARRGVREALVVFPIALTAGALVGGPGGAFFIGAIAAVDSVLTAVAALPPRRVALVVLVFSLVVLPLVGAPLFGSVYAFFEIAYFAVAAALTTVGLRLRRPTHVVLVGVALAPALVVFALAPLLLLALTHGLDGARR